MDLGLTNKTYNVEDRSWLASRDGTEYTQTITLDVSAFTANTHYPNGYIPSGIVLGQITASGLYGPYAGQTAEVQTVTITGSPTDGTFTLGYKTDTTAAIAYNATASAVQAALEALPSIAPGDVTVTGGPGPGTPYVVTFGGTQTGDVPQMAATGSFTGGSSPAIAVTTTTAGGTSVATGLQTAVGFLFNTLRVTRWDGTTPAKLGAPLLWRGAIKVARLPSGNGLDQAARNQLTRFLFR
jgi:hypothetical protein